MSGTLASLGGGRKGRIFHNLFNRVISLENLFKSWREFRKGKRNRSDVQDFEFSLEDNLFQLHQELKNKTYRHSNYIPFYITDPKLRHIHKATVRDRVLHQAVFRILYPIFDKSFINDSFSCRVDKGTHRAVKRLKEFCQKLSKNNSRNIFILKCDIKKFFDSIDRGILIKIIKKKIFDHELIWLIDKIIKSYKKEENRGIPLGNVTSQLFANIYLNEFDRFVKHELKIRYYIRYCDDFIILRENKENLIGLVQKINDFLDRGLNLSLHSDKIIIRGYRQGIDFLGYVVLPYHIVLRTKTKRRILKKIKQRKKQLKQKLIIGGLFNQSLQSYLGILKHCRGYNIKKELLRLK